MIPIDYSYTTQIMAVEISCKIYAYFVKKNKVEESQFIMSALPRTLQNIFAKEDGPSSLYQNPETLRNCLIEINQRNPNLTSFKIKRGNYFKFSCDALVYILTITFLLSQLMTQPP